jgi:hypothetical protein
MSRKKSKLNRAVTHLNRGILIGFIFNKCSDITQ